MLKSFDLVDKKQNCGNSKKFSCMVSGLKPAMVLGPPCSNEASVVSFFNWLKRNFVLKPSKGFSVFNNTYV